MNDYNELIERCKEICAWQDTGLLKGDALRNFAKSRPYCNQINSVSRAEDETLREVADAFLVMAARVAELEAERAELEKQEPVTTVDDRYNADGKSCHITDDLPAGMPLYAAPPVAAPVRLTDKQIYEMADERCFLGTVKEIARAIESAVLRANGFKVEE